MVKRLVLNQEIERSTRSTLAKDKLGSSGREARQVVATHLTQVQILSGTPEDNGDIVQMVRTLASQAGDREFKSLMRRQRIYA